LVRALDLPATAPRNDLKVMISEEICGEGAQAQLRIFLTEEGEQLSLRGNTSGHPALSS